MQEITQAKCQVVQMPTEINLLLTFAILLRLFAKKFHFQNVKKSGEFPKTPTYVDVTSYKFFKQKWVV